MNSTVNYSWRSANWTARGSRCGPMSGGRGLAKSAWLQNDMVEKQIENIHDREADWKPTWSKSRSKTNMIKKQTENQHDREGWKPSFRINGTVNRIVSGICRGYPSCELQLLAIVDRIDNQWNRLRCHMAEAPVSPFKTLGEICMSPASRL